MIQAVIKIGLAMAIAAVLPSCFGVQAASVRTAGPVVLAYDFHRFQPGLVEEPVANPLIANQALQGSVVVRGFHEPGDYAHRNYCGAGASLVLLSAWMPGVPDLETVAQRSSLNPNRGEFGAGATAAINSFLEPIVLPALNHAFYHAEHITTLDAVEARIQADIMSPDAVRLFGHGAPVIVQTMTKSMPGWHHWNATHMITIFAFDFSHNDPGLDTVTYAETPSPLAGYRGPDFQTISLNALWFAMQAYTREAPSDPMNVIS